MRVWLYCSIATFCVLYLAWIRYLHPDAQVLFGATFLTCAVIQLFLVAWLAPTEAARRHWTGINRGAAFGAKVTVLMVLAIGALAVVGLVVRLPFLVGGAFYAFLGSFYLGPPILLSNLVAGIITQKLTPE